MKGLDCYNAKSKEHHRGWAWNRLVERLDVPVHKARGLYLVGPKDVDGTLAVKKGFARHNLLAVDESDSCVSSARNCGAIAIRGNLQQLLTVWNDSPLDFLFLDTCSLVDTVMQMVTCAQLGAALRDGTVLYANMQKGREADIKKFDVIAKDTDHRGQWLEHLLFWRHWQDMTAHLGCPAARPWEQAVIDYFNYAQPVISTYCSSHVHMHSLVIRLPFLKVYECEFSAKSRWPKATKRKLIAAKAVRTMKASV